MATINDDYITEKEQGQLAQLREIDATGQADSTFSSDTSVREEDTNQIQPGKFEGQGGTGTQSVVDLTIKENKERMWEEYYEIQSIGKRPGIRPWNMIRHGSLHFNDAALKAERDKGMALWFQKYYGMSEKQYRELRSQKSYITQNYSLAGLDNTFRNLADLSAGATTDWVMDFVGVLPGLGGLDNYYDRKTKSKSQFMQNARSMLSIVVPSILSGGFVSGQLKNYQLKCLSGKED